MTHSASEPKEKTEVTYGLDNIIRITLTRFLHTAHTIDSCIDESNPAKIMTTEPIVKGISEMNLRGVKSRVITEITRDNILYCKQLMKMITELRHLEEVTGNFSISDKSIYQAAAVGDFSRPDTTMVSSSATTFQADGLGSDSTTEAIYSTVGAFVAQQQYFFEMLWKKAIPADQRMREIEYGIEREVIETIQGPVFVKQFSYTG